MLHLLLMILKILGILILGLLGIVLAVLLLVLFVPLRYCVDASFDGKPGGGILLSWLMYLITVRVNYDGKAKVLIKVLWFRLFDQTVWPTEEAESTNAVDSAEVTVSNESEDSIDSIAPIEPVPVSEVVEPVKPSVTAEVIEHSKTPEATVQETTVSEMNTTESKETDEIIQKSKSEILIEKLVTLIRNTVTKIICTYQQLCGKVETGQQKIEQIRAFLNDQENRSTFALLWNQVKKLVRHVFPRKISGCVRFGFDDPATTGQILTYVSPFYGFYAKTLKLEPVFEQSILDGEIHVKGYIRAASMLWILIRVVVNKNFRVLLKKARTLGKM